MGEYFIKARDVVLFLFNVSTYILYDKMEEVPLVSHVSKCS